METIKNIQKISFFFFIIIGFTHLISGFVVNNQYQIYPYNFINRLLDMPFILAGLFYGLCSLKIGIYEHLSRSKIIDAILIIIGISIISLAIYINLFIPDK